MSTTSHESSLSHIIRPWNEDNAQIVLVLVGLTASGKSTFAKALEQHFPEFHRCNQDDLDDRKAVEQLARMSLQQGLSVCVDRTNFDETQRSHWIRIAREFPSTRLWCIIFDTPINICSDRLQSRTNHPTIRSLEQGIEVLYRFKSMLVPPSANEGFERIFRIKPEDHSSAEYTRDELQTLLVRVATSSPPKRSAAQRNIQECFEAVSPRVVEMGSNWRDRSFSKRSSGRGFSIKRGSGRSNSGLRPSDPGRFYPSDSFSTGHASLRNIGRRYHEEARNVFQNDGRISKAAEQAQDSNSRHAPDRMVPSKQTGDGGPENPIQID